MKTILTILLLYCGLLCGAQDSSQLHPLTLQLDFAPVPVSRISSGDTSFSNALSIAPALDIRSKSGWGLIYSPAFVTSGSKTGIYMHTVTAGYENYGNNKFDMAVNYSHYFFTNVTSVPYSPINNELFAYWAYTKAWLKPAIALSYGFGKDSSAGAVNDVALAAGFGHSFKWEDNGLFSSIEFVPSLLMDLGTNEYFSFLKASKYISHSHNFVRYVKKGVRGSHGNKNSAPAFSVNNLEFNFEGSLEMQRFTARPSASLFLPVRYGTENALYGYWQLSLQYRL